MTLRGGLWCAAALLLVSLRVTAEERRDWSGILGMGGRAGLVERVAVVLPNGDVFRLAEGDWDRVALPVDLLDTLDVHGLEATLVHNHPYDVSLSEADLGHLTKPGVARVVALGPDGTTYEAMPGRGLSLLAPERDLYRRLEARVRQRLANDSWRRRVDPRALAPHVAHVVARVLASAEVIHYVVAPAGGTAVALSRYGAIFDRVVADERRRVKRDLD